MTVEELGRRMTVRGFREAQAFTMWKNRQDEERAAARDNATRAQEILANGGRRSR